MIDRQKTMEAVSCQLQFPVTLKIDAEMPYLFQEKIRDEFPLFEQRLEVQQDMRAIKHYEFISVDEKWRINLTHFSLSISTKQYITYEEVIKKLEKPLSALIEIYEPMYFTGLGLNYIDIFCKSRMGLDDCSWNELLQPYCLGMMGSAVGDKLTKMSNTCELICDDRNSRIRVKADLLCKKGTKERCLAIDRGAYVLGEVYEKDINKKLEYLNEKSNELFEFITAGNSF